MSEQQKASQFELGAHQRCVADLPWSLMKTLQETMFDESNDHNECASFVISNSRKSGSALRLWIDHQEKDKRVEEDEFRFALVAFSVDKNNPDYNVDEFTEYSKGDEETIFCSNDIGELVEVLGEHVHDFLVDHQTYCAEELAQNNAVIANSVCEHGSQRRACPRCDDEQQIAEYEKALIEILNMESESESEGADLKTKEIARAALSQWIHLPEDNKGSAHD